MREEPCRHGGVPASTPTVTASTGLLALGTPMEVIQSVFLRGKRPSAAPVFPRWRADAEFSNDDLRDPENVLRERGALSPPPKRPKVEAAQDGSALLSDSPSTKTLAEKSTARGDDELWRVLSQAPTWRSTLRSRPRLRNVGTIGDWLKAHPAH
mmetsp:Transcript_25001/g.48841  ORF Transcript_25001/g.48841 Transcript_25001/m.48841 type:complete len:154 (+) Transcript_25001:79-540(+)